MTKKNRIGHDLTKKTHDMIAFKLTGNRKIGLYLTKNEHDMMEPNRKGFN